MAQNFTTDVTQWQGIENEPISGSNNLVDSNGIYNVKRDALFKPVSGLAYEITPNTEETDTIYYADGTTATLSGYTAKKYQLAKGTVVKITISKNYVNSTYAIIAYKDSNNNFYPILRGPFMYYDNNDMYLTITPMMNELIVVGGNLVGIDTHYENYTDALFKDKKVGYFVKNDNTEVELATYTLYYFDVKNIEKAYLYVANEGSRAYHLFVDDNNIVVGTPFKTSDNSSWNELSIPSGASILKVSSVNPSNDYPNAKPCKLLLYQSNIDIIKDNEKEIRELIGKRVQLSESDLNVGTLYQSNDIGNVVTTLARPKNDGASILLPILEGNIIKVISRAVPATPTIMFVDADMKLISYQDGNIANGYFYAPANSAYVCVNLFKNNYAPFKIDYNTGTYNEITKTNVDINNINKILVNVGMSIWHYDETAYSSSNTIDGEGTICKGYQSWLKDVFVFNGIVKYAYSGYSLGVGDLESASIMATKASTWDAQDNAIWTLDTITNDFQRDVPLGTPSDFENATGINTFYGALRAFKDRVLELTTNPIIVCSNAVYRTFGGTENNLGLTLEDYEKAMCYAAARSGWHFVDQYRNSINAVNANVALYDGLHLTNFGYRLAVKPWIEQFNILQRMLID